MRESRNLDSYKFWKDIARNKVPDGRFLPGILFREEISGKKFSYRNFFREFFSLSRKTPALFLPSLAKKESRVLRVAQNSLPLTSIV